MVDHASLTRLVTDVGEAATAGMVDRFVTMLPGRVARLRGAVAAGEPAELRDAALSLGCSASMLGAHALAAASAHCRTAHRGAVAEAVAELERVASATRRALTSRLPELSPVR